MKIWLKEAGRFGHGRIGVQSCDKNRFVSPADGAITLQRILIPVDNVPHPQPAVEAAAVTARALGCAEVTFTLVYVGATGDMLVVREAAQAGWD